MNDYTDQLDYIQELINTKFPELGYNRPQQYHLTVYLADPEKDDLEKLYLEIFPFGYFDNAFVVHMSAPFGDGSSRYTPTLEDLQAFSEQNKRRTRELVLKGERKAYTYSPLSIFASSENCFDDMPVFFDYLIWYDNNR